MSHDAEDATGAPQQRGHRVSRLIAAVVFVCSLGGVLLSAFIAHEARRIDQVAADFTAGTSMSRDLAHLEALVGQWLVSTDILLGHGDTHLWDGAQEQADGIRELLGIMDLDTEEATTARLVAQLGEIERLTAAYVFDPGTASRPELLARADRLSSAFVATIERARESVDRRHAEVGRSLAARRGRFLWTSLGLATLYIASVVVCWAWLSSGVVRPLERLTASVRQKDPDFTPDGPFEVRQLSSTLHGYATALLSEQRELAAAEERSRELATRLETVMRTAPDPIVLADSRGTIVSANEAARSVFGFDVEPPVGQSMTELLVDPAFARELPDGTREAEGRRRDGSRFPVDASIARTRVGDGLLVIAIFRDLTARREMELQLRQAQRLESVGRLAAGLAHEINTPIQFVGDSLHFLEEGFGELLEVLERHRDLLRAAEERAGLEPWIEKIRAAEESMDMEFVRSETPGALKNARDGIETVAEIVRAMRRFTHPHGDELQEVDLNAGLRDTAVVAKSSYAGIAALELDLAPLPPVRCHRTAINQVLLNLIVNAAQAIDSASSQTGSQGSIRVRSRVEGEGIVIEVEDDGPGIPEGIRDLVFDPFFTTKEVGQGTGQGLAIARSVAERHGGSLTFETGVGPGTVFRLTLPVAPERPRRLQGERTMREPSTHRRLEMVRPQPRRRTLRCAIAALLCSCWATASPAETLHGSTPGGEQLPSGGALGEILPLPDWLSDNLRASLDLSSRANYSEERDDFFYQQFIGLDVHKVIRSEDRDLATFIAQVYATHIDNVEPVPPGFDDDHDWELIYRILNLNLYALPRGVLNLRVGHFEIPFGLEYPISTNGTLRDYLSGRNLGLKADWGASINGVVSDWNYEFALTRGSGNEYSSRGDPYTAGGRVGWSGMRADAGVSGYYAELRSPAGTSERWRAALDGQLYEGAFGLLAEVGYGETDDRGVSNNLVELNWVNPDETWLLFLQTRLFFEEFASGWDEAVKLAAGVRWAPDAHWALSAQLAQDALAFDPAGRDTVVSLQIRFRL